MIEFEKWWSEFEPQITPNTFGEYADDMVKTVAGCAWKHALEFIAGNADGSCGVRRCVPMMAIEEELGKDVRKEQREDGKSRKDTRDNIILDLVAELNRNPMFTAIEIRELLKNTQEALNRTGFPSSFFLKALFKIMKTIPTVENVTADMATDEREQDESQ